jgi:predicted amidohydrolase YtcJ
MVRKIRHNIHAIIITVSLTLAISGYAFSKDKPDAADFAFTNGKVYTVNEAQPWAEAVAVKGNKAVYVGDAAGVAAYQGEGTEVIDLAGKMLLPGFISAHDHLIASNWTTAGVNLFGAKSKEEYLKLIKEYAVAHPDDKVVKGIGWNVENLDGEYPTAKDLDTAVPDRPAIILDYAIHDGWLNSAALKAGNVTKDTPDVLPGTTYWKRDKEGNPAGVAIELQWMGTYIAAGAWEPEKMMRESAEVLFAPAARNGTTAILNPGVVTPNIKDTHGGMETDFKAAMAMLAELDKQGKLLLRVQALPMFKFATAEPAKFVAFAKEMSKQYNSDRLSVRSVKIHPEGNATVGVAPFLEPYAGTDNKGSFNLAPRGLPGDHPAGRQGRPGRHDPHRR